MGWVESNPLLLAAKWQCLSITLQEFTCVPTPPPISQPLYLQHITYHIAWLIMDCDVRRSSQMYSGDFEPYLC